MRCAVRKDEWGQCSDIIEPKIYRIDLTRHPPMKKRRHERSEGPVLTRTSPQ